MIYKMVIPMIFTYLIGVFMFYLLVLVILLILYNQLFNIFYVSKHIYIRFFNTLNIFIVVILIHTFYLIVIILKVMQPIIKTIPRLAYCFSLALYINLIQYILPHCQFGSIHSLYHFS